MSAPPPGAPPLRTPRHAARAWRASALLTRRRIDLLLRARSAAGLPIGRARFRAMGLPEEAIEAALRQVRSVAGWDPAWAWVAQRFLGEARRDAAEGRTFDAAVARRHAALAYHAAQLLVWDDRKKARALRSSSATIYAQALPTLMPSVERVEPAWRATTLPGYLARPANVGRPAPLVVLLNGSSTAKEETLLWADPFLRHGLAVLALDWPGTGETAPEMTVTADCDDLTDGVLALAREDPTLDAGRVALVGFSLGGALAVRCAAFDRRVAAVVVVTPPYRPARWLATANPLVVEQLTAAAGGAERLAALAADFDLSDLGRRLRVPLLGFGAGRDLVVPPGEAARLCSDAGDLGTLVWYPGGGHGLYEAVADWTDDAARWLADVLGPGGAAQSTGVDGVAASRETRRSIVLAGNEAPAQDG